MSGRGVESTEHERRAMDERAVAPMTAMAILVAVVALVGAAGYFVLSDVSHSSTTTSKSCSSTNVTQCSDRDGMVVWTAGQFSRESIRV